MLDLRAVYRIGHPTLGAPILTVDAGRSSVVPLSWWRRWLSRCRRIWRRW